MNATTVLPTRWLGSARREVTTLGFGAARLLGDGLDVGPISRQAAIDTVHRCLDAGIRYIDTAPLYGASEEVVGSALASHPQGSEVVVATKVGLFPRDFDYSAASTLDSVRRSATRLQLDSIPVVQLHEINADSFDRVFRPGGALDGLRAAQESGLIGQIGVTGGSSPEWVIRAVETGAFTTVLVWMVSDLLNDRLLRELMTLADELDVSVIAGAPYAAGLLSGDRDRAGRRVGREIYRERFGSQPDDRIADLESVCAHHHVELGAAALQFALREPAVRTTVPAAYTVDQVTDNVRRLHAVIPDEFWAELDLVRAGWAPTRVGA